jgi:hypothetical protein
MSVRSVAALMALLLLQLCSCASVKPSDAAINEIERRHNDSMMLGYGSGGGSM